MGSDSDLPVLGPGLEILDKLAIPYTTRITSAHRTPTWMAFRPVNLLGGFE
jgi:phosphoribosylaminoimidazole carboxylase